MKNKFLYLFAAVTLMFTACDLREDRVFNESVDDRLGAILDEYRSALVDAPNGWIMSLNTNQGGYLLYMTFNEDGRVTMLSDQEATFPSAGATSSTPKESSYKIKAIQMPSIQFDTYNYLHKLADPAGSENGGTNGTGLATDFEFDIINYSGGTFTLRGVFKKVYAYLKQATAEEAAAIMNGGLKDVHTKIDDYLATIDYPTLTIGDNSAQLTINSGRLVSITTLEDGLYEDRSVSAYMDLTSVAGTRADGDAPIVSNLNFFSPVTLFGKEISGLKWNGTAYEAVMTDGGEGVVLYDNGVPPFPLLLGLGQPYTTMTFSTYSVWQGTISEKYYNDFFYKTWNKLYSRSSPRYLNKVVAAFTTNAAGIPVLKFTLTINPNADGTGSNYSASVELVYTVDPETEEITFTDRIWISGNATTYGAQLNDMFDVFTTIVYTTQPSASNINGAIKSSEPHTFKVDWVRDNSGIGGGAIGGLFRVDDPELYFCGTLSR